MFEEVRAFVLRSPLPRWGGQWDCCCPPSPPAGLFHHRGAEAVFSISSILPCSRVLKLWVRACWPHVLNSSEMTDGIQETRRANLNNTFFFFFLIYGFEA